MYINMYIHVYEYAYIYLFMYIQTYITYIYIIVRLATGNNVEKIRDEEVIRTGAKKRREEKKKGREDNLREGRREEASCCPALMPSCACPHAVMLSCPHAPMISVGSVVEPAAVVMSVVLRRAAAELPP